MSTLIMTTLICFATETKVGIVCGIVIYLFVIIATTNLIRKAESYRLVRKLKEMDI